MLKGYICKTGKYCIYLILLCFQLLLRVGVTAMCPEGTSWLDVVLPDGQEALAVGAGPTGLVWVVTWSGSMLVRTGVSWQNTKGDYYHFTNITSSYFCLF